MSQDVAMKFSKSNPNKLDLILFTIQRLQEDLELAKCQLKTAIREVANKQEYMNDTYYKLNRNLKRSTNASMESSSIWIGRIHQLDASRSISYTAKRSNYSACGVEQVAANGVRRTSQC